MRVIFFLQLGKVKLNCSNLSTETKGRTSNSELPSAGRGALEPSESASDTEFKPLESSLSPPGEVPSPKERASQTPNSRLMVDYTAAK